MTDQELETVAGNGLINRRHLLGLGLAGMGVAVANSALAADAGMRLEIPVWSKSPGPGASGYGGRSSYAGQFQRMAGNPNPIYPGGGASRSPLQHLQGTITPNGLHFERHHAGIPDIDPSRHKLVINGLVRQPLVFSYEDLLKYPMVSKIYFLECSGNSGALWGANGADAPDGTAQSIHGLVSCAEWTGIPLSTLLDEAGVDPQAQWISAVGADAASMGRSVPMDRAMDDVMVALYQNGEPVRPGQGYPMRLLVPGCEGNISVKWLTQIKLTRAASQFRDETSKYTDTQPDRLSRQFTLPMGTKSLITSPSGQMSLHRQGLYQINGIAWSGRGSIRRVEVSADGGQTWADALLDDQHAHKALARFRIPWQWTGGSAILQSRATDSQGNVQPTRTGLINEVGILGRYHFHGIQSWSVNSAGKVRNVFA